MTIATSSRNGIDESVKPTLSAGGRRTTCSSGDAKGKPKNDPLRKPNAIVEKLSDLLADRSLLQSVSDGARETAQRHSWKKYRATLLHTVTQKRQTTIIDVVLSSSCPSAKWVCAATDLAR